MPARSVLLFTTARSYRNDAFQAAAAHLGLELELVVHAPPGAPARVGALPVNFDDLDAVARFAAARAAEQPVAAVLAADDSGVVAAAHAAASLGLPHNDPAAAAAARDKHRMRRLFAAAGVPSPWFRCYTTARDPAAVAADVAAGAAFPCVVKPLHLNGSRGVMRADTPAAFTAAVGRLARMLDAEAPGPHAYLVEAFIPGQEVAVEALLDGGRLHLLALFDKPDPLDGPFFEETIYTTPSRLPQPAQKAIVAAAEQAAHALGLRTGPLHAELRLNERGPWLLEAAARSIGGLCGHILRFGLDRAPLEELILRQACGLPWSELAPAARPGGVMMIPIPEAGVLRRVEGLEAAAAVPGVEGVEITARLDQTLTPLPEGESYLGFIFARTTSPAQAEAALRAAHAALRFTIVPEFSLA